jgi:hypothetical protein
MMVEINATAALISGWIGRVELNMLFVILTPSITSPRVVNWKEMNGYLLTVVDEDVGTQLNIQSFIEMF